MPRWGYTQLRVVCLEGPYFGISELREAVEYLKGVPQTGFTGLQATVAVKNERINLLAQPMLQLADIVGKTPAEVWEMFDAAVDAMVADHEGRRDSPFTVN